MQSTSEPAECFVCKSAPAKTCTRCGSVSYCGKECQAKDWKSHKKICKSRKDETSTKRYEDPQNLDVEICNACAKYPAKACAKCKKVFYCSKECQGKDWKSHKIDCVEKKQNPRAKENEPTKMDVEICNVCAKHPAQACSRCRKVFYCSKECQVKDWKTHKNDCVEKVLNASYLNRKYGSCSVCNSPNGSKCSKCNRQFYCSRECQKKDWDLHKPICDHLGLIIEYKSNQPNEGIRKNQIEMTRQQSAMSIMMGIGEIIPNYFMEYKKKYPEQINHLLKLEEHYLMTTCSRVDENIETKLNMPDSEIEQLKKWVKRWGYFGPDLFEFLQSGPNYGDIFAKPVAPYGKISTYGSNTMEPSSEVCLYQTIRNSPVLQTEYKLGKTYVSIGFVDLHQLLNATFTEADTEEQNQPLKFFGYDMSEFIIARNLIIYDMMINNSPTASVLQVWFSSGWSESAEVAFKTACQRVLKNSTIDPKVENMIRHWAKSRVSLLDALLLVFEKVEMRNIQPLDNLADKNDRIKYARYCMTGLIFGDDADFKYGNVTMFSLPVGYSKYMIDHESVYSTLSTQLLISVKGSLHDFIVKHFKNNCNKLKKLIISKQVECNFALQQIKPETNELLREIKKLNPYSIDWSNIFDYWSNEDFIMMAKKCSVRSTTHTAHTINWSQQIFGASIIDYDDKSQIYRRIEQEWNELFNTWKEKLPFLRQDKHIKYYMNKADIILQHKLIGPYLDQYFMDTGATFSRIADSENFNPFTRSNCIEHFKFNFDNE